jgi:hypothetical protein
MLEIHITGKTTKKQNFDYSTPLARSYPLNFMLNGETNRVPMLPPDASTQMAWEDAGHKLS